MITTGRKKIVVLGMMTRMPVAGVVWQTAHYLVGLKRLGYEVYYVESHARTPSMLMRHQHDDASARAVEFIASVMQRFGMAGRWAFHALHDDGRCYGMDWESLKELYRSAALIINLHGGTIPLEEHTFTNRLIYVETDPVETQIELHDGKVETIEFLKRHVLHFSFGENFGNPDCRVPQSSCFRFLPTRQPVVLDFWDGSPSDAGPHWTTIGNWRQHWRSVSFEGETYTWSKHFEFLKFLELPRLAATSFELALSGSSLDQQDRRLLQQHGWLLRDSLTFSNDPTSYRQYVWDSLGEFTVAKDQNVRLRSGWFSDRSATYLAAGRPVITQETGFSNILSTGWGLFAFSNMEEAVASVQAVLSDYTTHAQAAKQVAREFFSHEVVLGHLLGEVDI